MNQDYISEWSEISDALVGHHSIFYRFWSICSLNFSESIKTAAVFFDKNGDCVDFRLNKSFWDSITFKQKVFVISHECIHVISNHGKRAKSLLVSGKYDKKRLNIAMDLTVNHALVDRYGFRREEIDPDNRFIWLDKINQEFNINLPPNKCFEYYYTQLKKVEDSNFESDTGDTVDDHDGDQCGDEQCAGDVIERMASEMDEAEKEKLRELLQEQTNKIIADNKENIFDFTPGNSPAALKCKLDIVKPKKKKKWESVIRKWMAKRLVDSDISQDQWVKESRRFSLLPSSLSIPQDVDVDDEMFEKDKMKVLFFLDTSGSCIHLKDRFFRAAMTLPERKFDVELFCFDTKVYKTSLKSLVVQGGGGTSFVAIENFIKRNYKRYPHAVFVITDGYASPVKLDHPKRWYWFLSSDYTKAIPSKCNIFKLKDYE